MNNIFNIKRFGFVLRKDFLENRKQYALLFLTMLGIMAVVTIQTSWRYGRYNPPDYMSLNIELLGFLSLAFFAGGVLFAATFMKPMNSKLKRISYLISPSSDFEKYLSRWLIVTVGYILAFFAAMWIADALRVAVISARFPDASVKFLDLSRLYYPTDDYRSPDYMVPKTVFTIMICAYLFFQSLLILGATFWEKSTFVKTFTAIAVITVVYFMVCRWAVLIFYEDVNGFGNVLASFTKWENLKVFSRTASVILPVFTLTNWALAYFRLRESEIIKRL